MKKLTLEEAAKTLKVEFISNGRGTQAVHDTVVAYRANRRVGTHATKTKATVQKSGKKPWRQKGTGRARAGYAASPIWRGGGVVFGPQPRDYSKKTNKKTKKLALKKALGERIKGGEVIIVNDFKFSTHRTQDFVAWLKKTGVEDKKALLVDVKPEENLLRASRNVPRIEVAAAEHVNVEQILWPDYILVSNESLAKLGERL